MSSDPSSPVDMRLVAKAYRDRGWAPIPLKIGSKAPIHAEWPTLVTDDQTPFPGNIGNKLGKPSGLIDIDLDWPESRLLALAVLPPTGSVFGRASAGSGHYLYQCLPPPPYKPYSYTDPADVKKKKKPIILEIRSTGHKRCFRHRGIQMANGSPGNAMAGRHK
jgi:hypothetical protein